MGIVEAIKIKPCHNIRIQDLPYEILEKIIENACEPYIYTRNYYLIQYALVSRQWAVIANNLIWEELDLQCRQNRKEFRFYRRLTMPNVACGKYVRKLIIDNAKLWPICIRKLLQTCPNITELSMREYQHNGKGDIGNLLGDIQTLLPSLQKIDITYSEQYFDKNEDIERLIENRKDIEILATRKCKSAESVFEIYDGKKWSCEMPECHTI